MIDKYYINITPAVPYDLFQPVNMTRTLGPDADDMHEAISCGSAAAGAHYGNVTQGRP